ncbi:MAG: gamma-butyrobetaine hydroxylase-like domain-containing protein [Rhodospirillales bacterium]
MADNYSQKHHPSEIRLKRDEKILEVDFEDGVTAALPAELLRVESPSADVQGHGPGQKKTVAGRRHVGIMGVEPVGNYAVRIKFDDMHDTGIFTWDYLYDMGARKDEMWADYLKALDEKGLSRDP